MAQSSEGARTVGGPGQRRHQPEPRGSSPPAILSCSWCRNASPQRAASGFSAKTRPVWKQKLPINLRSSVAQEHRQKFKHLTAQEA